uniref:50S ribosomal protein L35 n=1 Tax=Rhodymenia pseudopalmata TaxID=31502 RepID=A0A1C9C7D8_RHOPU|nr:ribosomal protein L35 [Rhodymenia pseudopalmata]AOM64297.1 ribosomal protein L35 [Rhodymenia pseudopalmata]
MSKLKTSKSIVKRLKITSSGKFFRRRASRNHLLQKKTSERKQKLRKISRVFSGNILNFSSKLPYVS